MDITNKFIKLAESYKYIVIPEEEINMIFNQQTADIFHNIKSVSRIMDLQAQKYKSHKLTNSMNEQEKDQIDQKIDTCLKLCKEKIKELHNLPKNVRNQTEECHIKLAIQNLQFLCLQAESVFKKEFIAFRQKQKEKQIKLKSLSTTSSSIINRPQFKSENDDPTLMQENELIMKKYTTQMNDHLVVQKQIRDILDLVTQMGQQIQLQQITTEEVLQNAKDSNHYVEEANKNLVKATIYNEQYGRRWALLYFMMAICLLIYDFIA